MRVNHTGECVAVDRFQIDLDALRDLVNVVGKLFAELRDNPSEERAHFVEIVVVSGVAVDACDPDALEEFIDAGAHSAVVDETHVGQHVGEMLLMLKPGWHQRSLVALIAFFDIITGHSCHPRGVCDSESAGFPEGWSSQRR